MTYLPTPAERETLLLDLAERNVSGRELDPGFIDDTLTALAPHLPPETARLALEHLTCEVHRRDRLAVRDIGPRQVNDWFRDDDWQIAGEAVSADVDWAIRPLLHPDRVCRTCQDTVTPSSAQRPAQPGSDLCATHLARAVINQADMRAELVGSIR